MKKSASLFLSVITLLLAGCVQLNRADAPVIESFNATPGTITGGESATLAWTVSGADSVEIDQTIGAVALSGTRDVAPGATTVYTLTAVNKSGSVTATAQVIVSGTSPLSNEADSASSTSPDSAMPAPSIVTKSIFSIPAEDGNVMQTGRASDMDEIKVGDDTANKARQAFMSFDISTIPAGAKIEDAALNISGVPLGHPFNQLGPLGIYYDDYGSIDPSDFNSSFSGHIKTYTSLPTAPFSNAELINRLQSSVNAGDSRFQIRLQFQKYTDHNGKVDMWQVNSPELIVRYVK